MNKREEDLAILRNSDNWIQWPICPVIKRGQSGMPLAGIVIADDMYRASGKRFVYQINMWSLEEGPLRPQLDSATKNEYPSTEAMLADGWEVD
jgi:hypothetical protein